MLSKEQIQEIRDALKKAKNPLFFFDDDPDLTGHYFPPLDIPIENRQCLIANPTEHILILSRTFGATIASTLKKESRLAHSSIILLEDLF